MFLRWTFSVFVLLYMLHDTYLRISASRSSISLSMKHILLKSSTEGAIRQSRHYCETVIMEDEYGGSKGGKFRFKSKPTSGSKQVEGSHSSSNHHHHRHSRHRHRHHSDKRHKSSRLEPSPDTAFRESLFDALADDEGAAYWESVYGQPIHIYPRP